MPAGEQGEASDLAAALAAEVRAHLARNKMRVDELAVLTGKSRNYLYKRLRGEAPLNLNDLTLIADAFGVAASEILLDAERHVSGRPALTAEEERRADEIAHSAEPAQAERRSGQSDRRRSHNG